MELCIQLCGFKSVKEFVNITTKYNISATVSSGTHEISADSILGMFSLNLLEPLSLVIQDNNENIDCYINAIQKFIAN